MKSGFNYSFHRSPVNTLWAPDSRTTQGCPWTSMCSSKVARPRLLYLASTRRWTSQDSCRWETPLRPTSAPPSLTTLMPESATQLEPAPTHGRKRVLEHEHSTDVLEGRVSACSHEAWTWKQGLWMKHSGILGCKGIPLLARAKLKHLHHGYQTNYALSTLFDMDPLHIWG